MLVQLKLSPGKVFRSVYIWSLLIGSVVSISSSNWVIVWVGLELNMISFLGLMCEVYSKDVQFMWGLCYSAGGSFGKSQPLLPPAESLAKYFLSQAIGTGVFLLFPVAYSAPMGGAQAYCLVFLVIGLLLKAGAAPFHQWFPAVCASICWSLNLVLMTWQKVAPLFILSKVFTGSWVTITIGILNLGFGVVGALGQTQFRSLLAYSSIVHMGWMIAVSFFSQVSFFFYFLGYIVVISPVLLIFMSTQAYGFKTMLGPSIGRQNVFNITLLLLSVAGVPPFLGFAMKAFVLYSMVVEGHYFICLVFCGFAAVSLFYYLNLALTILISTSYSKNKYELWSGAFAHVNCSFEGGVFTVSMSLSLAGLAIFFFLLFLF